MGDSSILFKGNVVHLGPLKGNQGSKAPLCGAEKCSAYGAIPLDPSFEGLTHTFDTSVVVESNKCNLTAQKCSTHSFQMHV